jgi:hypothetical protein
MGVFFVEKYSVGLLAEEAKKYQKMQGKRKQKRWKWE